MWSILLSAPRLSVLSLLSCVRYVSMMHGHTDRYALRTDGAQHLVAQQLWTYSWLQRTSLDVALTLVATSLALCALACTCIRRAVRRVQRRKPKRE